MAKEYLAAGKIVAMHGVRGEMRLKPWSDDASFLSGFRTVYLDEGGKAAKKVLSAKAHGNVTLLRLEGIESVEAAEQLRGQVLYIKKSDAALPAGSYFVEDILGLTAVDEANGAVIGTVSRIEAYPANDVWYINTGEKEYLIPNIPSVVKKIDFDEGKVYLFKMKGLFEDED